MIKIIMKQTIITMLLAVMVAVCKAQYIDPIDTMPAGRIIEKAGNLGIVGTVISSTSAVWLFLPNTEAAIILTGLQSLAGVLIQINTWDRIRKAGLRMQGKQLADVKPFGAPPAKN